MTPQQTRMRRAGAVLIAFGVGFALLALPFLNAGAKPFLQLAYWPMQPDAAVISAPVPLLVGIAGGLTAGLGAMLWAVATQVVPVSPMAGAKVVRTTAWVWYVVDSTASIAAGAPFNAVLNLGFLAIMLWACRLERTADTEISLS
ncbi:MAG: hypothetical protein AAFQ64_17825 [Pseudomonadota bacterium]